MTPRDERSEERYRTPRDERSEERYRTLRDERSEERYRTPRDERSEVRYRTLRDERSEVRYRTLRDERSEVRNRTLRDERSEVRNRTLRDERSEERNRTPRRAAVLGSPVAHSRSPRLHLAAYRALGLDDWTYDRIECTAAELPALVGGFGPEWVGVSVTMPGKFAALRFADEHTARAELVGSANTLVHTAHGWRADNTDIDGVTGALGSATGPAIVLGSGGTAPAAVVGLAELGVGEITVVARNREKAGQLLDLGAAIGVATEFCEIGSAGVPAVAASAGVLVSTIPADAAAPHAQVFARVPVLLDAIYDPWPTPLAAAVGAAGGRVVSGLQMLLHQAFRQVELFTGRTAPRAAMAAALR